jgi:hypothetical protein
MPDPLTELRALYQLCKRACAVDWSGGAASSALEQFVVRSLIFLQDECAAEQLISRVPGKRYLGFRRNDDRRAISRPVNESLFISNPDAVQAAWETCIAGSADLDTAGRILYSAALAPCLALELFDRQNKKGPATFFECFIGHIFSRAFDCNPEKTVWLPIGNGRARMTMDFLFHPPGPRKFHLPVKMSTRERVVQAWAHHRILEAAYGAGAYTGIMVLFAETKLDSRSLEVVEICVPDQWLVYQTYIAQMERIYYFDIPNRHRPPETEATPALIQVKDFARFFPEKAQLLVRPPASLV